MAQEYPQPPEDEAEVVAGGGEDGVDATPGRPLSLKQSANSLSSQSQSISWDSRTSSVFHIDDLIETRPEQILRALTLVLLGPHRSPPQCGPENHGPSDKGIAKIEKPTLQDFKAKCPLSCNPDYLPETKNRSTPSAYALFTDDSQAWRGRPVSPAPAHKAGLHARRISGSWPCRRQAGKRRTMQPR